MNRLFTKQVNYRDFDSSDIRNFAHKYGYNFTKSKTINDDESGYMMDYTHYNEKVDIIHWKDGDVEFEFYARFFSSEFAENLCDKFEDHKRDRILTGLTFAIKLPYDLPSVTVQSLTSPTIWNLLGLTNIFTGRKVKLEGDFNKFFHVYTPSGEAPNAFLALAPDTMIKMLRAGSGLDFQFAGRHIYFNYDIRLKHASYKNLWGLMGDSLKVDLEKDLSIKIIDQKEWLNVFERSKEYSKDIVKAFRVLRKSDKQEPMQVNMPLDGIGIVKILLLAILAISLIVTLLITQPLVLVAIFSILLLNSIYRYLSWKYRIRKLLERWDYGEISSIVR